MSHSPEYRQLLLDMARVEPTLSQGNRGHWDYYRQAQWQLRDMEIDAYRDMERQYNAMLRRYAGVRAVLPAPPTFLLTSYVLLPTSYRYAGVQAVLPALEDALTAMLPLEYRMSRAVNKLRLGHLFQKWKLVPEDGPDW